MLKVEKLKKSFGEADVLKKVSFQVSKGECTGLLGRNGAGKSTLIKTILKLYPADGGAVMWEAGRKPSVGYLPEERGLFSQVTIEEQLMYFGRLEGLLHGECRKAINEWSERLEFSHLLKKKAALLSKGNQQRVQLAIAFMHDPDLYILDEPFSGLDPVHADLLAALLTERKRAGKTIMMSSHRMEQIEPFLDSAVFLKEGELIDQGPLQALKEKEGMVTMRVKAAPEWTACLNERGLAFHHDGPWIYSRMKDAAEGAQLLHAAQESGIKVTEFSLMQPSLHELFIERMK